MELRREGPPAAFFGYLAGIAMLVLWGLLPSEVSSSYDWQGAVIAFVLIVGIYGRSQICRWILIGIGLLSGVGVLLIQTAPLEFVATMWSILAFGVTSLLMTPAMRQYTSR